MAKIPDYRITNFSGGLVTDKSDLEMDRNEVKELRNLDIDERGRVKRRRGSSQFIETIGAGSTTLENSTLFQHRVAGGLDNFHLVIDNAGTATLYRILNVFTTAAITPSSTSISVHDTGDLAASGNVMIDGDLIAYTSKGVGVLNDVTGILVNHPAYSLVTQNKSLGSASVDTTFGCYFAVLNNLLYIQGRAGGSTFDGTNITPVADADEPDAVYATVYRTRVYCVGAGVNCNRIYYSDAGDATSWTSTNYFDVEDQIGERVSALREGSDNLIIFKWNSIFTYDEVQLRQRLSRVGAYSHRVIQKIGKVFYTFCPQGIFATNGSEAEKISQPVDKYLKGFRPKFSDVFATSMTNCFSGQFDNKYLLFIGDLTEPVTASAVVLVYDTITKKWTTYEGFSNFTHFASLSGFGHEYPIGSSSASSQGQAIESLFAGDSTGKYYRLFENRYIDSVTGQKLPRGGDLTADLVSNSAGSSVSVVLETKWLDCGSMGTWKKMKYLSAFVEKGSFNISYKLDKGDRVTELIPLGDFSRFRRVELPDKEGYQIAFRVTGNSRDIIDILNALIVEDIELTDIKK